MITLASVMIKCLITADLVLAHFLNWFRALWLWAGANMLMAFCYRTS